MSILRRHAAIAAASLIAAAFLATSAPIRAQDPPKQVERPKPEETTAGETKPAEAPTPAPDPASQDPSKSEVFLPSFHGWNASLVYDNDVGVWMVGCCKVFPTYGAPEVIGLDDKGRCTILSVYSGKWTRWDTVGEGKWLGALTQEEMDPGLPGPEIYTGGTRGNLYQVYAHGPGVFSTRLIAEVPGKEINTSVSADFLPGNPGNELALFTWPGGLLLVGAKEGRFTVEHAGDFPDLVRQAILLPGRPGEAPEVAVASRAGRVATILVRDGKPEWNTILQRPMGFGRVALRPGSTPESTVFYSVCDDGLAFRHERRGGGEWRTEAIYAGPQGHRGVAAGRFDADPAKETIATFGYSGKVQLLTRERDGWKAETLFVDRDKGHWMQVAELDGRNATDEILCSGYGKRVVLLSRVPGYGLPGVATDPVEAEIPHAPDPR